MIYGIPLDPWTLIEFDNLIETPNATSPVADSSEDIDQANAWSDDSDETIGASRYFRSPEGSPIDPVIQDDNVKVTFVAEDNIEGVYYRWYHLTMAHPQVCFFFVSTVTAVLIKGVVFTTTSLILT